MKIFMLSIKVEPELQKLFAEYSNGYFLSSIKERYSDVEHFSKAVNTGLKSICERLEIIKVATNWVQPGTLGLAWPEINLKLL